MSQQYPPDQGQPQPPYPQQPYPPQYPPFQQPMQPAPKKKSFLRSPLGIGCGVLTALVVLVIIIVVIASATNGGNSGTSSSSTNTTGNTPAASSSRHSIGQSVTSGSWVITMNKVSTSHGSQFDTPKAGDVFLVINVTLKNTDASAQPASSLGMFALKDSSGQTYNQDITYGGSPDGNVASGSLLRGNLAYDVPASMHSFTLQFTPGLDASQLVEWNIKE